MNEQGQSGALAVLIDNPEASEIFATESVGFLVFNGNIHITFATARGNYANESIQRVVIHRLVMPILGAQGLAIGLYNFLKEKGHDPVFAPPREEMQ